MFVREVVMSVLHNLFLSLTAGTCVMRALLLIIIFGTFVSVGLGQITASGPDEDDVQYWNDIQLTVPLASRVDFVTKQTLRFGQNITKLVEGRISIGAAVKLTRAITIAPSYTFIKARSASGRYRIENRLSLAGYYRFPFKKVTLTHKSTYERRLRRPRPTWRYKPMLTLERAIPENIIPRAKLFISDELFYDSALDRFSRNRFSIGITKTITKKLALDIYYMRQNDGTTRPGDLNVIGTLWKVKL